MGAALGLQTEYLAGFGGVLRRQTPTAMLAVLGYRCAQVRRMASQAAANRVSYSVGEPSISGVPMRRRRACGRDTHPSVPTQALTASMSFSASVIGSPDVLSSASSQK